MINKIPQQVLDVYTKVKENNFQIYFVGGCVRDMLLEKDVKDWDFATDATPDKIASLFDDTFYDNSFGTVGVPIEINGKNQVIEITTFRKDGTYSDFRRPDVVSFGKTIEEDLQRRDFTVNAIALKIVNNNTEIIDPYNGQIDLKNKILRAVGDPDTRFNEDALRILRGVRLVTQLGFSFDPITLESLTKNSELLEKIAKERIRDEFIKILASDFPYDGVVLLRNTNLLEKIIPELLEGIEVSQVRPGRHHTSDVYTHNLLSLKNCPSNDPIVRFASLIHDIGKPRSIGKDKDGLVIFHNHEVIGANMSKEICDRLRFSKKNKDRVYLLIRWHMFTVSEHTTDASIRRFIRRIGIENVKDMIDLRVADRLGSGSTPESWRLKLFKDRIEKQLAPAPFSINDLKVNGVDVMNELNIKPGRRVGEILQILFEEVDENLELNEKDYLIRRIHELARVEG